MAKELTRSEKIKVFKLWATGRISTEELAVAVNGVPQNNGIVIIYKDIEHGPFYVEGKTYDKEGLAKLLASRHGKRCYLPYKANILYIPHNGRDNPL